MKKIKIEYLIYIFILLSPILDACSNLINTYTSISISPTMILRPIIPLTLLLYIFFKERKYRLPLIISSIIFIIYGIIHLLITNKLLSGISYGTITEELSYIINYTYNIYLLFILLYFYKNKKLYNIDKYLFIMLIEYLFIIYFSIFTKTSFTTYVEGMGYRSYFLSGNSISTILILLFSLLISKLNNKDKNIIINILLFIFLGIYLIFLVGTRTGMLGFILVSLIYLITSFLIKYINKKKINKKSLLINLLIFLSLIILISSIGSETLKRRKHINEESNNIIDINTNDNGHTTGDTSVIVWQINNNDIPSGYMSNEVKNAYLKMYNYANKNKIDANNNRLQQLIFNIELVKSQKNLIYILFGNGRIVNYGEMILEMEIPCILINFGLIGFILYVCPYIILFIYNIKKININNINKNKVMCMFGILLSLSLSFIAGYVLFSSTCTLLLNIMVCKINEVK